jgi:ABC-2 type transport system permease protein
MNISRVWSLVAKDLRMGPRSPVFVFALLMPVLITFLVQVVFLTLFDPKPRLGIADLGHSEITRSVSQMDGIELIRAPNAAELRRLVELHDVDAGLVLAPGFDEAVRAGKRPELPIYLSGESLASSRILLAITTIDLVREVEKRTAPVTVTLAPVGDAQLLPVTEIIVVGIVLFVLLITGMFAPAFLLVEERERHTLDAILVTPVTMSEVLLSKALLGFIMACVMAVLTLALNRSLTAEPLALLATLAVGAVTCCEIGLIYATTAKDAKTLYSLTKTLNIFILGPLIFYFFPSWPQWIAKLFPTYWFINPLYEIATHGASFADIWRELAVGLAICAALVVPIGLLGRRLQVKLATG